MPSDVVLSDDALTRGFVSYVELLDLDARADVGLQKVGLAAVLVVGDDDVLAGVEEAARRVQADEAHAADDKCGTGHQRSSVLGAKISSSCMRRGVRPCSYEYSATVSSDFWFDFTPYG